MTSWAGSGLDFRKLINEASLRQNDKTDNKESIDFTLLYNKSKQLLDDGANSIALLLDDIPEDFINKFGNKISERSI